MPYIHFTDEQKLRANSVDLVEFLRRQGEKLIPSGRDKRLASDHSITVRGNEWYDHEAEEGGGPISFVQTFYGLSYPEAVTRLLGGEKGEVYQPAQKKEREEPKEFALPPANQTMRRVYAYLLQQRHISREILNAFAQKGLIYESRELSKDKTKEYHNAVFVGIDEHGVARHAHKRGIYTQGKSYRGNVEGCDPRHSFHWTGTSDRLYVFEAPIDLLAFLTLYPEDWQQHSYVALCGTAEHAMLWMLEQNPKLQKIILCLDHDAAGIEAAGRLTDILCKHGYDSAEGLLTAMFLLVAEYLPTEDENGNPVEKRHIVSVFKLVQELLAPSKVKGKNQFQILLEKLPPNHKARWFAGSALNTAEQAMASVISTVLSRLNAFLDSEMEQILCFDTAIDAEKFCNEKSAIFIVLPEEDQTKYFMVSLILQNLYREILTVADENGGRLKNRVVFFADELGTCPPIQSLELMFSASRSRGLMLVPIVQSITGQLKKNYGAEGAEVIVDNCQVNLYGGFAPASQTAVELSKALGSRTVMSGSISRGKNDPSQSLQMIERPLMTPDELKSMPKGSFIVAKTGVHPMKVKLRLFLDWGIRFGEPYEVPEKAQRAVAYADKQELEESIIRRHYGTVAEEEPPQDVPAAVGGMNHGMQAEKNSRKTILRP